MGEPMPVPASIDDLSANPADNYPGGSEQVFPNLDDYLRFHAACIAQLRDELQVIGTPLAGVTWWGGARSAITLPRLPVDGQLLNRTDYPELWAFVSSGGYPLIPEADWQSTPLSRGSFSSGNGSTTFRMPDLNGKQTGSIGAVGLRGDGAFSAGEAGKLQDSQNLEHSHSATAEQTGAHTHTVSGTTANAGGHYHGFGYHNNNNNGAFLFKSDMPQGQLVSGTRGALWNGSGGGANSGGTTSYNLTTTKPLDLSEGGHTHSVSGTAASAGSHTHAVTINNSGGTEARGKSATGCFVMRVK